MATEIPTEPRPDRSWLYSLGEELLGHHEPEAPVVGAGGPPGFPATIACDTITFTDWSLYVSVPEVYVARITSPTDAVAVCNWAAGTGFTVRAVGEGHNWSPLVLAHGTAAVPKVMLVDTTGLTQTSFEMINGVPAATLGTGLTMDAATAYLATLDNGGASNAPGYALPQTPAPGNLTLGGVLAIGGHGTLVPRSAGGDSALTGCLSNLILSFEAVVTDPAGPTPGSYTLRTFSRSEDSAAAFLTHLGRALITSVTLEVEPNYYLELSCLFPFVSDLFAAPAQVGPSSFSSLLDQYGRVEVLWFPYVDQSFVQCNTRVAALNGTPVTGPYNYPWMNDITWLKNAAIKAALFSAPSGTPVFTHGEFLISLLHQEGVTLCGQARDLEIYLKDTTLRVSLWGWALQLPRSQVQAAASQFFAQVQSMLAASRAAGSFPINAAMELRCNTLDGSVGLGSPPALAATRAAELSDPSIDTVLWLNVGTITGTPGSSEFYTELETWLLQTWSDQPHMVLRPEWSKAWAYSDDGPWTNQAVIDQIRASYNAAALAPHTLQWAGEVLASYDSSGLFTSPLLAQIFAST